MKNFALIGVAGYIAPRHLNAIKETQNTLVAAIDKNDSVGIIDSFFPQVDFFTEFERFDRYISKFIYEKKQRLHYISICSPNYLHDAHIRFALKNNADAICEKPIVLNPWNIDALQKIEQETQQKVYTILQLRLHPTIIALREKISKDTTNKKFDVDLTYITSRGNWYYTSWKGDEQKSGGITTNIGIHFFDMLQWIFGEAQSNIVHLKTHDRAAGILEFQKARVRWFLSINPNTIPKKIKSKGENTYRSIIINGEEIEFSTGFKDLHIESYQKILDKKGFTLEDAKKAVEITHDIRNAILVSLLNDYHPLCKLPLDKHPFH